MPDCAKFHQKSVQRFVRLCSFNFSTWRPPPSWIIKFLIFYRLMVSGGRDASPIQISSKSVDALWSLRRYSDFTIFQYDYNWPFGPQNYGPHFTHMSTLMIRKFWSAFYPLTVCKSARLQVRCILHVAQMILSVITNFPSPGRAGPVSRPDPYWDGTHVEY